MSSYEYHQILQFLYFEGYADSYESAECLLESLDDNEFEELICEAEVDNRKRLSADQKKIIRNRRLSPEQRLPVRGETPADTEGRLTQTRQNQTARDRGGRGVRGSQLPKYKKHSEYGGVTFQSDFYPEKVKARLEKLRAKSAKNNIRSFREEVVEYLFVEGYAETIESAELMAENISDNWVNVILDEDDSWKEKNFKPLSKDKKERVTGFLNRQMIKLKDYTNQADIAQDELKNPDYSKPPRVKIGTLLKKMKTGSKLMSNAQQARKRTTEREEGRNNIRKFKREDLEYILDTLISEGFAVDYDSAGCILESMSDEWIGSLLDEKYVREINPGGADRRARTTDPTVRPSRLKKMPDVIKQTESGFDKTASRRSPGARKRKEERRQGTGGFSEAMSNRPEEPSHGRYPDSNKIDLAQQNAKKRFNKKKEIEAKWAKKDAEENRKNR